jgi:hypothetical protein
MKDFFFLSINPFYVYDLIDLIDGSRHAEIMTGVTLYPTGLEPFRIFFPAFKAWAMASSEGSGFIQKKKFCPSTGRHHGSFSSFKLQ